MTDKEEQAGLNFAGPENNNFDLVRKRNTLITLRQKHHPLIFGGQKDHLYRIEFKVVFCCFVIVLEKMCVKKDEFSFSMQ